MGRKPARPLADSIVSEPGIGSDRGRQRRRSAPARRRSRGTPISRLRRPGRRAAPGCRAGNRRARRRSATRSRRRSPPGRSARGRAGGDRAAPRIVAVDHQQPAGPDGVGQPALLGGDPFDAAEGPGMFVGHGRQEDGVGAQEPGVARASARGARCRPRAPAAGSRGRWRRTARARKLPKLRASGSNGTPSTAATAAVVLVLPSEPVTATSRVPRSQVRRQSQAAG